MLKSKTACLFGSIAICSLVAFAQTREFFDFTYIPSPNGQALVSGVFEDPPVRFADLQAAQTRYQTYDEFAEFLQQTYPGLFDNFVLLHNSQSLQAASFEHPRLLLYQGGSILAFNEGSQEKRRVELIETDPQTFEMHFHEIEFQPSGKVAFNENPTVCVACHGTPLRPLWNPYDFWPNAFGSAVGRLRSHEEKQAYDNFRAHRLGPVESRLQFSATTHSRYTSAEIPQIEAFTQYISHLNMGRWVNQFFPTDKIPPYIYALIASLQGCEALETYIPDDVLRQMSYSQTSTWQHTKDAHDALANLLDAQYGKLFPSYHVNFPMDFGRLEKNGNIHKLSQMRWLLENFGQSHRALVMSRAENAFLFDSPANFSIDLLKTLYVLRPHYFTKLSSTYVKAELSYPKTDCQELKQMSLETLSGVRLPSPYPFVSHQQMDPAQPPIGRCMTCHNSQLNSVPMRTPPIPFERPFELRQMLMQSDLGLFDKIMTRIHITGPGKMPPFGDLTDKEKASIEAYLQRIQS